MGWAMNTSLALMQSIRISLSSSATCFPGLSPRTLSSFSSTASTASVEEVAIWAMALVAVVCGARRLALARFGTKTGSEV